MLEDVSFRAKLLATPRAADGLEPSAGGFGLGHDSMMRVIRRRVKLREHMLS